MRLAVARTAPAPATPAPNGLLQRRCACGGTPGPDGECAECKRKRLLRSASGAGPATRPPIVDAVLASPGRPLDASARALMEARFGPFTGAKSARPQIAASGAVSRPGDHFEREADRIAADVVSERPAARAGRAADFSRVRVHTDARAAASARAVDAHAYTVGSHIVFDHGRYAPGTPAGQRLLAHELAHVVQQGEMAHGPILRQTKCDHDGKQPLCGYAWKFEGGEKFIGVDSLIVQSLDHNLPGRWVGEVQSPYNPRKREATKRGRADALKVIPGRGQLRLEVIEIKSCAPGEGCARAADEAEGYKNVYNRIVPQILAISRAAEQLGGVRVPENGNLSAGQRRQLQALGVDLTQPDTADAFRFWNSLQNRLDVTYTQAFASVEFDVNRDGEQGTNYTALIVRKDCVRKRVVKTGSIELLFQVNKEGGISYRCKSECPEDDDERKQKPKEKPLEVPKGKDVRPRVDVQEEEPRGDEQPEIRDQPPDQPPADQPPADQPTPPRGPEIHDQGPAKPEIKRPPTQKPDIKTPPSQVPSDQPAAEPGGNFQGVPELVVTAAALQQLVKSIRAEQAAGRLAASEAAAAERIVEKQFIEVVDKIGESAPKLAEHMDGRNISKLGTEAMDDVIKAGAKEADDIAIKVATRGGARVAVQTVAKVAVVLAIVMTASEVYAAVNHLRKGGEIRIGLGGDDVELVGDTKIKKRNQEPLAKMDVRGDARLKDTVIDIDMSGIPSLKGKAEIQAENVTIRQSGRLSNGDPITVNIHAKLKNTTITITHRGRFKDGKAVIGGETVDLSDSNIEIDLPPDVTLPERQRKRGEPISMKGVNMKITEVPATPAVGPQHGPGGAGTAPGAGPPVTPSTEQKPVEKPAEKPPEPVDPAAKYKDLDEDTRQKIRAAGKPVQTLFDELTKPDPKTKGIPITNETVKRFFDTVPSDLTDAQLEALRQRMVPITTDDPDEWFKALSDAVEAARKPADDALKKEGAPGEAKPTAPGEPEKDKPDEEKAEVTAAEIFDMYADAYKKIRNGGWAFDWSAAEKAADKRRKKGETVKPEREAVYLGKTDEGVKLFATVRVKIISREKKRGTLQILSVGRVIDETGATHARPAVLTQQTVSGRLGW